ncbi:MAG: DUF6062 family protein [Anaerolineae bacterium]
MAKHTQYHELYEALEEQGCAICRLVVKAIKRYAAGVVYECANDHGVQQDVLKARGWCNLHAWQLTDQTGCAFDVAILYRSTLRKLSETVKAYNPQKREGGSGGALGWLRAAVGTNEMVSAASLDAELGPRGLCPACRLRAQTEKAYLETLLEHINDPDIAERLGGAGGLCWPHFRLALEQGPSQRQLQALVAVQHAATEALLSELEEFIRKNDYRFREEPMGNERDAWLRVIAQISGSRGVW